MADKLLFIFSDNGVKAYMLIYVDDIILTGNNTKFLKTFVGALSSRFSLKDLGKQNYFLGIEVLHRKQGLILSQHKYIRDILVKTNMDGAKKATTPLSTSTKLSLFDGTTSSNEEEYRSIVSALQYLIITRPDLSFAVDKLAQFMHKPSQIHFSALKRVLMYLKGTISYSLQVRKENQFKLEVFADSD